MENKREACLVCGAPLQYQTVSEPMECIHCHKMVSSNAKCKAGHYICDACHSAAGILAISYACSHTDSQDPLEIAEQLMKNPTLHMHGPEHHILVGAALLTAYRNSGGDVELAQALEQMMTRGKAVPGGACGFWGACGAAISAGMFFSIATKTTPLSVDSWGLSNRMTAECLQAIGRVGGPRCCKRNAFLSMGTAARFTEEHLGVAMQLPEKIACRFSHQNRECIRIRCPFYVR